MRCISAVRHVTEYLFAIHCGRAIQQRCKAFTIKVFIVIGTTLTAVVVRVRNTETNKTFLMRTMDVPIEKEGKIQIPIIPGRGGNNNRRLIP